MNKKFKCPFTGQEILNEKIGSSIEGNVQVRYYPVQIGDKIKYFNLCESLFDRIYDYSLSGLEDELNKLKPVILHNFINNNLKNLGGYIMHWDCRNAEGKPNHIILKNLLNRIETNDTYPKNRKQKADNLLLYIKKNQSQEGGGLEIKDDPIIWGDLFFLNYAEMLFYIKELEQKNLLTYNKEENIVRLTFNGLDYVEDITNIDKSEANNFKYQPTDKFNEKEKEILKEKIDELGEGLKRIEVGQQITYDDLMAELQELKKLLEVLGKKDWKQVLKGKLVDAGFGTLTDQVINLIINTFQDDKLLNG